MCVYYIRNEQGHDYLEEMTYLCNIIIMVYGRYAGDTTDNSNNNMTLGAHGLLCVGRERIYVYPLPAILYMFVSTYLYKYTVYIIRM